MSEKKLSEVSPESDQSLSATDIIINTAIAHSLERDSLEETINALLLSLRYLRKQVILYAGHHAQKQLDELIQNSLSNLHFQKKNPDKDYGLIPVLRPNQSASIQIMEDAINTIIMIHNWAQNEDTISDLSNIIIAQLTTLLNWVPDWNTIIEAIDEPYDLRQALLEYPLVVEKKIH